MQYAGVFLQKSRENEENTMTLDHKEAEKKRRLGKKGLLGYGMGESRINEKVLE